MVVSPLTTPVLAIPPLTTPVLVIFALIAVALVLFVTETLPPDVTAIAVLVSLAVLEPFTEVPAADAIGGFASPATVTIMAMYILSEGVQETGLVEWIGGKLARLTRGSESRLLTATVGVSGTAAGFINNTPVVAVFIPMITRLAEDSRISPSKLLLPLSFASMLGGTLTLIGSATNLLASDLSRTLLDRPFSMFTFSALGVVVLLVGSAYLLTAGRWLTPARIAPEDDFTEEFDLDRHLAQVRVREGSPLVGLTPKEVYLLDDLDLDLDLLVVERDGESFMAGQGRTIAAGDTLILRANRQVTNEFATRYDLRQLPREAVSEATLDATTDPGILAEVVIPSDSTFVGETLTTARLRDALSTTVLAIRRAEDLIHEGLDDRHFRAGDTLLVRTTESSLDYLADEGEILLTERAAPEEWTPPDPVALDSRAPLSLGILLAVVALAAFTPLSIVITALGGVVAMITTGCLTASDAYDAVSWNVIFLLAGVLPLGVALQRTGGAAFLADLLSQGAAVMPPVAVLLLFFLLASLVAALITPVATVVLLIPIAVDTASAIGANPFAFLLGVMFGASAAFATPIGYQTNLMVYGPGGYRFTDYLRVGGPLQLLLAVVATAGIAVIWPL
jgi:di/tricarboxylate transporter